MEYFDKELLFAVSCDEEHDNFIFLFLFHETWMD